MEHQITGRELIEYISYKNFAIKLTQDEADVVIDTINNDQYIVCRDKEELFLKSVDQEGIHLENTSVKELVDLACEINHIKIREVMNKLPEANMENAENFCGDVIWFVKLYRDKEHLDKAFEKYFNKLLKEIVDKVMKDQGKNKSLFGSLFGEKTR